MSQWLMQQQQEQMQYAALMRNGMRTPSMGMGMPGHYYYPQNRVKTEDVEKQVKDDVFKALEEAIDLDQCDPGTCFSLIGHHMPIAK